MSMDEEVKIEGNIDIDQALKEFEAKSNAEVAQTPASAESGVKTAGLPKMVKWVIKLSGGAIKDQQTAEYFLLALVLVIIGISLYFFFA